MHECGPITSLDRRGSRARPRAFVSFDACVPVVPLLRRTQAAIALSTTLLRSLGGPVVFVGQETRPQPQTKIMLVTAASSRMLRVPP